MHTKMRDKTLLISLTFLMLYSYTNIGKVNIISKQFNVFLFMELMYHYTTVDSLLGMTQQTSIQKPFITLWATHLTCLNDPEEKKFGKKIIDESLEELEKNLSIDEKHRISTSIKEIEKFNELLKTIDDVEINSPNYISIYVTSFSKAKDELPMWSMYAKNGNGISLGFDREGMKKEMTKPSFAIPQLYYGTPNGKDWNEYLKATYLECYTSSLTFVDKHNHELPEKYQNMMVAAMTYEWLINIIPCRLKNEAYFYEKEIRITSQEDREVKYRTSKGFIIPYIEIPINIKHLKEIIIGPTLDKERITLPLKKLLSSKGIDIKNINIYCSKIPYRE